MARRWLAAALLLLCAVQRCSALYGAGSAVVHDLTDNNYQAKLKGLALLELYAPCVPARARARASALAAWLCCACAAHEGKSFLFCVGCLADALLATRHAAGAGTARTCNLSGRRCVRAELLSASRRAARQVQPDAISHAPCTQLAKAMKGIGGLTVAAADCDAHKQIGAAYGLKGAPRTPSCRRAPRSFLHSPPRAAFSTRVRAPPDAVSTQASPRLWRRWTASCSTRTQASARRLRSASGASSWPTRSFRSASAAVVVAAAAVAAAAVARLSLVAARLW